MSNELTREERDEMRQSWTDMDVGNQVGWVHAMLNTLDANDVRIVELERERDEARHTAVGVMEGSAMWEDDARGYREQRDSLRGEVAALREACIQLKPELDHVCKTCVEHGRNTGTEPCHGCRRGSGHGRPNWRPDPKLVQLQTPDAGKPEADVIAAAQKQAATHNYGNLMGDELGKKVCAYEQACRMTNAAVERMNEKR